MRAFLLLFQASRVINPASLLSTTVPSSSAIARLAVSNLLSLFLLLPIEEGKVRAQLERNFVFSCEDSLSISFVLFEK